MSRRKKASAILGPDGKPYLAPAKPQPEKTEARQLTSDDAQRSWTYELSTDWSGSVFSSVYANVFGSVRNKADAAERTDLREAVTGQIAALVPADFDEPPPELPARARDLTAYNDAFASARKNCPHADYEDVVYAKREAFCNDCRSYFRRPRGMFG